MQESKKRKHCSGNKWKCYVNKKNQLMEYVGVTDQMWNLSRQRNEILPLPRPTRATKWVKIWDSKTKSWTFALRNR